MCNTNVSDDILITDILTIEPGDVVDTVGLDVGPASLLDIGSDFGELVCRDLACPVGLDCFFNLAVST